MDAVITVDAILEILSEALSRGERVRIPGLGTFVAREYKTHEARKIDTGELFMVKAYRNVCFIPGEKTIRAVRAWEEED